MENKTHLFVDDYGEMLAQINDLDVVSFETDGGYQGTWCLVATDGERLFYYMDFYGSCSGCDWLEDTGASYSIADELYKQRAAANKNYAVPYQEALDYCGGIKPKYIVPKSMPLKVVNKGEYEGFDIINQTN